MSSDVFFKVLVLCVVLMRMVNGKSCANGTVELFAIGDDNLDSLKMEHTNYFQLFGQDAKLVTDAFLAFDPSCRFKSQSLRKRAGSKNENLAEFESKEGSLQSEDQTVTFFFCTRPEGSSYNHMVTIPAGRNYQTVYIMIVVLVVTLCMSATFSGLNLAIMSFSINDLKLIQESDTELKNRQRAGDVLRLRRRSNFVLCTIVCGNCFCNTSITILMNHFGDVFGFSGYFFVELSAAGLLLIFTEILPALICTKNALKFASMMQYFVIFAMILTLPISFPLSKLLDAVLGKDDADDAPVELDTNNIDGMQDDEVNEGNNFNDMMNVVKKTLALRQKKAEDVMTMIERVTMISDEQPVTQVFLEEVHDKGHSRLPVFEKNNRNKICGVLNIKDLMLLMDDEGRGIDTDLTAGTMLSVLEKRKKHCFVLNTMPVHQFMSELQQGCTMAIVVQYMGEPEDEESDHGENYRVIGIITLEDYIEEIVGEIFDEKDKKDED